MSGRPQAMVLMDVDIRPTVLDDALLERLSRTVDLTPADPGLPACGLTPETRILVTGWGCPPITAAILDAAPGLAAVIHAAGSVKGHLCEEVWRRGIAVSSAAEANAEPVADFTVAAITLAGKRAQVYASRYAAGEIGPLAHGHGRGNDGRTVGVIGASRIGRRVIARLTVQGRRVLVADPFLDPADAAALGVELTELDELCRAADVVTVHAPELPTTYHLLDSRRLGLLPDGALVVNTARGSLVDTEALTRHCASGRLDAVLDVTDPEPLPPGHPLFGLPNVLVTPHIAGAQGAERLRLGAFAVSEVERFVRGEPLLGSVRLEDLATMA